MTLFFLLRPLPPLPRTREETARSCEESTAPCLILSDKQGDGDTTTGDGSLDAETTMKKKKKKKKTKKKKKKKTKMSEENSEIDSMDPTCKRGVFSDSQKACCAASCGTCGGAGCGQRIGGSPQCCPGTFGKSGRSCNTVGPPCMSFDVVQLLSSLAEVLRDMPADFDLGRSQLQKETPAVPSKTHLPTSQSERGDNDDSMHTTKSDSSKGRLWFDDAPPRAQVSSPSRRSSSRSRSRTRSHARPNTQAVHQLAQSPYLHHGVQAAYGPFFSTGYQPQHVASAMYGQPIAMPQVHPAMMGQAFPQYGRSGAHLSEQGLHGEEEDGYVLCGDGGARSDGT